MATQKAQVKDLYICSKCGSTMISRMLAQKNGGTGRPKLVKILQCKVCRHWALY